MYGTDFQISLQWLTESISLTLMCALNNLNGLCLFGFGKFDLNVQSFANSRSKCAAKDDLRQVLTCLASYECLH